MESEARARARSRYRASLRRPRSAAGCLRAPAQGSAPAGAERLKAQGEVPEDATRPTRWNKVWPEETPCTTSRAVPRLLIDLHRSDVRVRPRNEAADFCPARGGEKGEAESAAFPTSLIPPPARHGPLQRAVRAVCLSQGSAQWYAQFLELICGETTEWARRERDVMCKT